MRSLIYLLGAVMVLLTPLSMFAQPSNDACADATYLSNISNFCATYDNTDFTYQDANGNCSPSLTAANVWFSFDAIGANLELMVNPFMEASVYISLWQVDPASTGDDCDNLIQPQIPCNSDGTLDISNLDAGETYYISINFIGSSGGAIDLMYDLCINNTDGPPNDDPCLAEQITPNGGCTNGTTVDATPDWQVCGPDYTNSVYYEVTTSGNNNGLEISLLDISLQGNVTIAVLEFPGGCGGTPLVLDSYCGPPGDVTFFGLEPGLPYMILIATTQAGEGEYDLCVLETGPPPGCSLNDDCPAAEPIIGVQTNGGPVCVSGCNIGSVGDVAGTGCFDNSGFPTVWYSITTDNLANSMNITFTSNDPNGTNQIIQFPQIALYQGDCNSLTGIQCTAGSGAEASIYAISVTPNTQYLIAVSSTTSSTGYFDLCVSTTEVTSACVISSELSVTNTSLGSPLNGPYFPGEEVSFEYTIDDYQVDPIGSGNNCQWLQAIIPYFGDGWDPASFDGAGMPLTSSGPFTAHSGQWDWYDVGEVDYNFASTFYSTFSHPQFGWLTMCSYLDPNCSNTGLAAGEALPAGWYAYNSSSPCPDTGDPDDGYGDGAGCNTTNGPWTVTFTLKVREFEGPEGCDATGYIDTDVHMFTFADGETGCWNGSASVCAQDVPVFYNSKNRCCKGPEALTEPQEICSGNQLTYEITSADGSEAIWTWTVQAPIAIQGESDGMGDRIIQNLTNTAPGPLDVTYFITGESLDGCIGEPQELVVTVYPPLEVEVEEDIFSCSQATVDVGNYVDVVNGSGAYEFVWSNGVIGLSNPVTPNATTSYDVTVTDLNTECETVATVVVEINELFDVDIEGMQVFCEDLSPQTITAVASGGAGSYISYEWNTPSSPSTPINTGGDNSLSVAETGDYSVTVTDANGCPGVAAFTITINENPDPGLITNPIEAEICPGADPVTVISAPYYQSGIPAPPYEYDWDPPADFPEDVDGQNQFQTNTPGTYVVTVTDNNGCSGDGSVEIDAIPSPDAFPASSLVCYEEDSMAVYDLTSLETTVNGDTNLAVEWFIEETLDSMIQDPANYVSGPDTVWARVVDDICASLPVPVILDFLPRIETRTVRDTACDQGDGNGVFDLTELDTIVNMGSDLEVNWFEDADATDPIADPTTHSGAGTVYATVSDTVCSSDPVAVELTIEILVDAFPATATACDEGGGMGTFDLTALNETVNGSSGLEVSWFTDSEVTDEITDPGAYVSSTDTVYAQVYEGDCASAPQPVALEVVIAVSGEPATALTCDRGDGTGSFDLTAVQPAIHSDPNAGFEWFEDMNTSNPIADPTAYVSGEGVVYVIVNVNNCISEAVAVTLEVEIGIDAFPATLDACDPGDMTGTFNLTNANNTVNGGTGFDVNWYEDQMASQPVSDPSNYQSMAGSVWAIVTDGECVSNPVEVTLTVSVNLDAFSASGVTCDEGNGQGTFDLTTLNSAVDGGNGFTVEWYEDEQLNDTISDPTAYPGSGGSVWAIVRDGDCVSLPVEVSLSVEYTIVAFDAQMTSCDEGGGMGTFDLTTLNSTVDGGNGYTVEWYEDAQTTTPVSDATAYLSGGGTVYAIVRDGRCVSLPAAVDLNVEILVDANPAEMTVCDEGSGQGTFDLTTLDAVVSGNAPGTVVSWYEDNGLSLPIPDPASYQSDNTTVYAQVEEGRCLSETVAVELRVEIQLFAQSTMASTCDEGGGIGTFDFTDIDDAVTGGEPYSVLWFEDMAGTTPIPDPTNYVGSNGGTVYAMITDGRCISALVPIALEVTNNLPAFTAEVVSCDDGTGQGIFNLTNANDEVSGGLGFAVEWYEDNDLNQPIADPSAYPSGSGVVYAITIDGACRSNPVEVQLILILDVPSQSASEELCDEGNGTASFDLLQLENVVNEGSGLGVSWYTDAALTNEINPTASYVSDGETLYAIVRDGSCESEAVEVVLSVNTIESFSTAITSCDEGGGLGTFDLTAVNDVVNGGSGLTVEWYLDAAISMPIPDPAAFQNTATIVYASVTDGTCRSAIQEIQLNIENNLPAFEASETLCDEGGGQALFDLSLLESSINGGSGLEVIFYTDPAGTDVIANVSNFTSNGETLYAKVVDGACQSLIVEVDLVVAPNPVVNAGADATLTCVDSFLLLDGSGTSQGAEFAYSWSTQDGNIVTPPDMLEIRIDQPGTYQLEVINTNTECESSDEVVISEDVNRPDVDAGEDAELNCSQRSVALGGEGTITGDQYEYLWNHDGQDLPGDDLLNIVVEEGGTYTLTVFDTQTGCRASDAAVVTDNVDILTDVEYVIDQPACFGESNGCIIVESVSGGEVPYEYALDDGGFSPVNEVCGLEVGEYTLRVRDVNGCETTTEIIVPEPAEITLDLGGSLLVEWGDTASINASTNVPLEEIDTIYWDPFVEQGSSLLSVHYFTLEETVISAVLVDEDGCMVEDQLSIFVTRNFKVYAPNAFSPQGDDINSTFILYGNQEEVSRIDRLELYSRWGERVFQRTDIQVNDEQNGWDGTFEGEEMPAGIYGFYAEVTFVDGSRELIKGDVLLMR